MHRWDGGGNVEDGDTSYYGEFLPLRLCPRQEKIPMLKNSGLQHVVLVGGFGASDWLFKQLQKDLGSQGLKVVRPELYVYVYPYATRSIHSPDITTGTRQFQTVLSPSTCRRRYKPESQSIATERCRMCAPFSSSFSIHRPFSCDLQHPHSVSFAIHFTSHVFHRAPRASNCITN